jgi:DNA modification methylase
MLPTNHKIFLGDARGVLEELAENYAESVTLLVTSPPYFVGRDYESYLKDEAEYWEMLSDVFTKCEKLIAPFGKVAINFADRYANKKLTGRVEEIAYIPFYASLMAKLGFDLWTRIIWRKEYTIGEECKHVLSPTNKHGQMRVSPNWEYVFVWRKPGEGKPPIKEVQMTDEEWAKWVDGVWVIPSVRKNYKIKGKKVAMFPPELPRRLIKMYTQPGDLILDPFVGTGTTIKEAMVLGCNSINVELDQDNVHLINQTLGFTTGYVYTDDLFDNEFSVEFIPTSFV